MKSSRSNSPIVPLLLKLKPASREYFFCHVLSKDEFLQYLVADEKLAEFALKSKLITERLNKLSLNNNKQLWQFSCVAHSLLILLHEFKIIDDVEFKPAKELEIYSKIWRTPGNIADIKKVIPFLSEQGFDTTPYIIKKYADPFLKNTFIANEFKSLEALKVEPFDETKSIDTSSQYIAVIASEGDLHMIYAKFKNGKLIVTNPDPMEDLITTYNTLQDCFEKNQDQFAGVIFKVTPKPLLQNTKTEGKDALKNLSFLKAKEEKPLSSKKQDGWSVLRNKFF